MASHSVTRPYVIWALPVFVIAGYCSFVAAAFSEQLSPFTEQKIQYSDYLAWNTGEPYWFNQYIGVEQRKLSSLNKVNSELTSRHVAIGTQLFDRLIVSGNAGYLLWPENSINQTRQLTGPRIYWGLSTRWYLNRRIDLKAQWQQIQFDQTEHILLMGIDVKLNF